MLARYRLTVVVCALSWFLVGLHYPVLHELTDHGRVPHWTLLAIVAVLVAAAVATLWGLLRAPGAGRSTGAGAPAA